MNTWRNLRGMNLDLFCLERTPFFTDPLTTPLDQERWGVEPPGTWTRQVLREWTHYSAPLPLAEQGWKIHVSATPGTAGNLLQEVAEYCFLREYHFKHLTSPRVLSVANSKYAARFASGKFITIYPPDNEELLYCLNDLEKSIGGIAGPYILSDLRWNEGPLHLRYGGFHRMETKDELGHRVLALRDGNGELVPDVRSPYFSVPEWAPVPGPVRAQMESGNEGPGMDYDIIEALHFSNGGGVYRATHHETGRNCVLKEARPHAGLDGLDIDAITRLQREGVALESASPQSGLPLLLEKFTVWEHSFLAVEELEGISLRRWNSENSPDIRPGSTQCQRQDFGRACKTIIDNLRMAVRGLHRNGWIHGDVHPDNIFVTPDLAVRLLDLEQACRIIDPKSPGLGAAGFTRRDHGTRALGTEDDLYGIGAVALWLFTSLMMMAPFRPHLMPTLVDEAVGRFGLDPDWMYNATAPFTEVMFKDHAAEEDTNITETGARSMLASRGQRRSRASDQDDLRQGLINQVALGREAGQSPWLPGDVHQILHDDANLTSGAAGMLWSLHLSGGTKPPALIDYLQTRWDTAQFPGLLNGTSGIAVVLATVGLPQLANRVLAGALEQCKDLADVTLSSGTSGTALAALAPELALGRAGIRIAENLAEGFHRGTVPDAETASGKTSGLAEGWSGPAIVCARLARLTGNNRWLRDATSWFAKDIECTRLVDGMRLVDDGEILYPYLANGSAGLAVAAGEIALAGGSLPVKCMEELLAPLGVHMCAEPGLFDGRLGLAAALQHLKVSGFDVDTEPLSRHLAVAGDYAVDAPHGGAALVGRGLRALTFDLSTGSAGWLAVDGAIRHGASPLPALSPLERTSGGRG